MTPEVQLWKVPPGAEIFAVPRELEVPRGQIIHMVAHMMKLYGIRRVSCNISKVGPCGVTSPEVELMPAFEEIRPMAFRATETTVIRGIIPIMMAYGIVGMSISLNEQDKTDVLKMWSAMDEQGKPGVKVKADPVVIEGEGHEQPEA
jgi:hypothetical protein